MKFFIRFLISLVLAIGIACLILIATGNSHLIKAVKSTYLLGKTGPTIGDFTKFENRKVKTGTPQFWQKSEDYNTSSLSVSLLTEIESFDPAAFLVIKDNQILFETYWEDYSENSLTNSFSMAKSFTSLAIGAAIQEGKIESVKQKVSNFIPEFETEEKAKITIEDLLKMSSGIDFGESYGDPFGFMAKTYYGSDLYNLTVNKPVKFPPNEVWHYQGGNTLLLSFILKKATGFNLSDYFADKFWKPIGAEKEALWTLNEKDGIEKSYCCFYSNAKDFARIGQLMLDSGVWEGRRLISSDYYSQSLIPVMVRKENEETVDYYGYQWWMNSYNGDDFYYARGIQGQYIIWVPNWNSVIVRLGHKRDPARNAIVPKDVYTYLKAAKSILEN